MKTPCILLALFLPIGLSAQSIEMSDVRLGPKPGEAHPPIVMLSLGHLSGNAAMSHWSVSFAPVTLAALAYPADSARAVPSPRLVWELDRSAFARLTGATFSCKRPGDTRVRVRWLDASGATIATDSTVIRCS